MLEAPTENTVDQILKSPLEPSKGIHVLSCPRPTESESQWGLGAGWAGICFPDHGKHTLMSISVSVSALAF